MNKRLDFLKSIEKRPILTLSVLAFGLNLILEALSRRSLLEGIGYLFTHPVNFLYNFIIILLTLSLALLINRKLFAISLVTFLWLALGIADCILLGFRTTPLRAVDFRVFKSALKIASIYFTPLQIALIAAIIIAILSGIVYLWIKGPKHKASYPRDILFVVFMGISVVLATNVSAKAGVIPENFENIANAYEDYGFVYCFSRSVVDIGIKEPDGYNEDMVEEIKSALKTESSEVSAIKPNIIMVQLESFFDVERLKEIGFSEDPIPVFHSLMKNYSSGSFTVPVIGAGTANTEFEVITQMSTEFFGAGEYPYTTILQESTSESTAYNLKELGYSTHAIHNNTGTFYDRNLIYSMLGFDTFTSSEYMENAEENPLGWLKDDVLTEEILKALTSTAEKDYIYTVSVQAHGKYPKAPLDTPQTITLTNSGDLEEEEIIALEYYINQLKEMDNFISELLREAQNYPEPTVVVLYGDHLPSLGIEDEDLSTGNTYSTEYIIWSNFAMDKADKDLYAYQISSEVLGKLGINNGYLTKLHELYSNNYSYKEYLNILQYDMLYGEKYLYEGETPYTPSMLKMGIEDIVIKNCYLENDSLYIKGQNFTKWSKVYIGEEYMETEFIDSTLLSVKEPKLPEEILITVKQVNKSKEILSSTEEFPILIKK
ncbi:LTA synthase family protein [Alloiococcus sp. CFN-8]|uniref:LTA synthase family protein n=1 Tax=Alloiococcus sp. CFN-8 TaxID=3416081 RepID=UPI003CF37A9C